MADCPECFSKVWPVVGISQRDPVTGRVGWFCESCEALYPDDDYIEMRDRPLGMPHTDGGREDSASVTEWFIHRFKCPDCGAICRADRALKCFRCGSQMEHVERLGEVYDPHSGQEAASDG